MDPKIKAGIDNLEATLGDAAEKAQQTASSLFGAAKAKLNHLLEENDADGKLSNLLDQAKAFGDKVGDTLHSAGEVAREKAGEVLAKAETTFDQVKDHAADAAEVAKAKAAELAENAKKLG